MEHKSKAAEEGFGVEEGFGAEEDFGAFDVKMIEIFKSLRDTFNDFLYCVPFGETE